MKRTLILDEDDLVMVVKQDVVTQIDEHRGELTRTEFVNYLIQCQLQQMQDDNPYVTQSDFHEFRQKMALMMQSFMDCMISSGLGPVEEEAENINDLNKQIEALLKASGDTGAQ